MIQINDSGAIGSPTIIDMAGVAAPATVMVHPAGGGAALVELTGDPGAVAAPESAHWIPWVDGEVAVATAAVLMGPVAAIRITGVGNYSVRG